MCDDLIDYDEIDEIAPKDIVSVTTKGSYVGVHATGFRDFLLKPELLRAIVDCGFEHPSEGFFPFFPFYLIFIPFSSNPLFSLLFRPYLTIYLIAAFYLRSYVFWTIPLYSAISLFIPVIHL